MATTPRKDLPGTNAPNWSQRVTEELRVLMGRGGDTALPRRRSSTDRLRSRPGMKSTSEGRNGPMALPRAGAGAPF